MPAICAYVISKLSGAGKKFQVGNELTRKRRGTRRLKANRGYQSRAIQGQLTYLIRARLPLKSWSD